LHMARIPTLFLCCLHRFYHVAFCLLSEAQFLLSTSKIPIVRETSILYGLRSSIREMAREQEVVPWLHAPCWMKFDIKDAQRYTICHEPKRMKTILVNGRSVVGRIIGEGIWTDE